jgi:hypothetical protein
MALSSLLFPEHPQEPGGEGQERQASQQEVPEANSPHVEAA